MSHFSTYILVPASLIENGNSETIGIYIAAKLAPYDEDKEVPEYQRPCHCLGEAARKRAHDAAIKAMGYASFEAMREAFNARPDVEANSTPELFEQNDELWRRDVFEPFDAERKAALAAEPEAEHTKPNAECEACKGKGTYPTTYNPLSKWDWYRIGGRWAGHILGKEIRDGEGGFNFGDAFEQLADNMVSVGTLLTAPDDVAIPYALVTADGEWYERGSMGWWGISRNERNRDDWVKKVRDLYAAHPDMVAVCLDCHI
jgi:hypothetical protein